MSDDDTPQITKRRVTMRNPGPLLADGEQGDPYEAVDYVLPEHLDAYVTDARPRWQFVTVSEEPDAGPGGYHGPTTVHAHQSAVGQFEYRPPTPGSHIAAELSDSPGWVEHEARLLAQMEG